MLGRPILAAVLIAVGGLFITLGGALVAVFGIVISIGFGVPLPWFFVGLAIGLLTIALAVLLYAFPRAAIPIGVLAIVAAIVSVPLALAGFIVGFLLALIGGVVAVVGRPGRFRASDGHPAGGAPPWS